MPHQIFISYAREDSSAEAFALAERLGTSAFLDTSVIRDGEEFPARLIDGLINARIVVLFASKGYAERRFCQWEMRLTLAIGDPESSHLIVALGEGAAVVLDGLPARVATQSWPAANETERLAFLAEKRLERQLASCLNAHASEDVQRIAKAFAEESEIPEPQSLSGIPCSLPLNVASATIGPRFVGRANDLRALHRHLFNGKTGRAARLTTRISAGAGFGKTRLAIEYLHRYGPRYYRGGLFWVDAASSSLDEEFWRVLSALQPFVPGLQAMRKHGKDVRHELARALRNIKEPTLFVVDNVPEAAPDERPSPLSSYCPAIDAVTLLATSRQEVSEPGVRGFHVDTLNRDSAILLLTDNVAAAGRLSWQSWGRLVESVGNLPIALDLLNRCLVLGALALDEIMTLIAPIGPPPRITVQMDDWLSALSGQVPEGAVSKITEVFRISSDRLSADARRLAMIVAQWAPSAIPEELIENLDDELSTPAARAALRSRHFVTSLTDGSFGVMHRLMADFLRALALPISSSMIIAACQAVLNVIDSEERCFDPREWPRLNPVRPHAEALLQRISSDAQVASKILEVGMHAATLAWAQGDLAGAERLVQQVLRSAALTLGEEHPDTLSAKVNWAEILWSKGDVSGAAKLLSEIVDVMVRVLGEEHLRTLGAMNNLASMLKELNDVKRAREIQERVLDARTRLLGGDHPETLIAMENLATTITDFGELSRARELEEHVLEARTRSKGEEHPDTLRTKKNLAVTIGKQGDLQTARLLLESVLDVRTRVLGPEHPDTLRSMFTLALTHRDLGENSQADQLLKLCLSARTKILGEKHPDTLETVNELKR